VLLALGAAISSLTILREIGPHDEGLMLQAATRIADGQWPYRDFWWNYAPGQPVLLGAIHAIAGPSLLAWRIVRVAVDAITAVLAFRLARREGATPTMGLGVWVAVIGAMAWPATPNPNPTALALAFLALVVAPRRPVLGGAIAGLSAVFRLEVGVAAALAVLLSVGRAAPPPVGDAHRLGRRRSAALAAAGVALVGWLPFFLVAPGALLDQTFGFLGIQDLQRQPLVTGLDTADPNKLLERGFPLILLAGALLYAINARGRLRWAPLVLVGVGYLLARTDEFHLVPLAAVIPVALATAKPRLAAVAVIALVALHGIDRKAVQLLHPPALAPVPGPAGDGVETQVADAAALSRVLAFVWQRTPPGEPIFVAPPRFDQVTVGDPLLYVLADRPNPTRYDVIQPGVATTAGVQREIVADLERAQPAVLVRWLDPRTRPEDNGSGRSSGVTILDRHLADTYRPVARFGVYGLFERSP
jgi:hypothetical protein